MNAMHSRKLHQLLEDAEHDLKASLGHLRSEILDPVQQATGHTAQWAFLRTRILKSLGHRGLEQSINDAFARLRKAIQE